MTTSGETAGGARLKLTARLLLGDEIAMGPGKAALLEAIRTTGSISAGGRSLGMSYRRAWLLVETMNRCWREPLVDAAAGGVHGGGAQVTELGLRILQAYRLLENAIDRAATGSMAALTEGLADEPRSPRTARS